MTNDKRADRLTRVGSETSGFRFISKWVCRLKASYHSVLLCVELSIWVRGLALN